MTDDTTRPNPQEIPDAYCRCGCGQLTPISTSNNKTRGWVKGEPKPYLHGHNRRRPAEDRFWEKVTKGDGCWEWNGSRMKHGHGQFHLSGKTHLVHRFSWEIHFGPIPEGLEVCHHCDNPRCVRPAHLFLGDQAANMQDMVKKQRQERGSSHHRAILTESDVSEIRHLYSQGGITYKEIGAKYGVHMATIAAIIQRVNWPHVP